ncbi:MAG: hypothetical protein M0P69_01525 [Bacteroidales bacterium]|nr:hypothetical protein [Bacteroidales bacterium]
MSRITGYTGGGDGTPTAQKQKPLLDHELEKLKKSKEEYYKQIQPAIDELNELKNKKQSILDDIELDKERQETIYRLKQAEIDTLTPVIDSLKNQIQRLEYDRREKEQDIEKKKKAFYAELKETTDRLAEQKQKIAEQENAVKEKENRLNAERAKLTAEKQEIEDSRQNVTKLLGQFDKDKRLLEEAIALARSEREQLDRTQKETKAKTVALKGVSEQLELRKSELDLEVKKLDHLKELEQKLESDRQSIEFLVSDNRKVEIMLVEKERELEVKEKALLNRERRIKQQEQYLKEAQNG